MLAYLEGRVLERTENGCVLVTAGGIGYEIFLPEHALTQLPAQGGSAAFYTSFIVREDAQGTVRLSFLGRAADLQSFDRHQSCGRAHGSRHTFALSPR